MRSFLVEAVRQSPDIARQADAVIAAYADSFAGPVVRPGAAGAAPVVRIETPRSSRLAHLVWDLAASHRAEFDASHIMEAVRSEVAQLLAELGLILAEPAEAVVQAVSIAADPEKTEDLERASAKIRSAGVVGMSPGMLLLFVFMWLVALGVPVAQAELPTMDQAVGTNEMATVALALALTWRIIDKRRGQ
jgi:hypothetical protein